MVAKKKTHLCLSREISNPLSSKQDRSVHFSPDDEQHMSNQIKFVWIAPSASRQSLLRALKPDKTSQDTVKHNNGNV